MTKTEALCVALAALEIQEYNTGEEKYTQAIKEIKALAQTSVEQGLFVGVIAQHPGLADELAQSEQDPVLQNNMQHRMQMVAVCTASIGYWKEGDDIHPNYDTLALRDVARLYVKYAELYKAQPEPVVGVVVNSSGAIRMEYQDGSAFDISKHVGQKFYTTPPKRQSLTDEQIDNLGRKEKDALLDFMYENGTASEGNDYFFKKYARVVLAAEAKLTKLNT